MNNNTVKDGYINTMRYKKLKRVLVERKGEKWYWHYVNTKGIIVMQSSIGYSNADNAKRAAVQNARGVVQHAANVNYYQPKQKLPVAVEGAPKEDVSMAKDLGLMGVYMRPSLVPTPKRSRLQRFLRRCK